MAISDRHRKQSAQPFGEGEELFHKIFNHTNDSILIIDPEQDKIIDVNPMACDMLKYSREELLSTSISAIHPKDVPKLLTFTQSVYKQGRGWTDELTCLTKTGETLSAEISASVLDIGEKAYIIALVRDITERRQIEETLVRLASFPEQNPNPIIEANLAGEVTYCNPEAQERFSDLQTVDLNHPVLKGLKSIIVAFQNGEQEFFTREIDVGNTIYEQKICYILESNLIRIFNFDITERKQMGEALRESETRLARILDTAMDAIITIDHEQRITLFNSAAEKIFRCTASEAFGQSFDRFLSEDFHSFLAKHIQACEMSGERKCYTWAPEGLTALRADGEKIPIEATISLVEEAGEKFCTVILRDINERIRAEAQIRKLQLENIYLQQEIKLTHNFEEIICHSDVFKKVLRKVEQVASTDSTVLILGETGTGKELLARATHNISVRRDRPLVKVNCAALPANLIESALFGHEKGAFTGALSRKMGHFELADSGTIFLDEIGDLPMELQTKLLRVLQEGEIERLGNPHPIKIDVRVIAATNRNLEKAIESGTFREDLYYRLNVFPITCPSLRDRKEDIPALVKHFIKKFNAKIGKKIETVPQKVMDTLTAYHWPGNIRELENIIERALIISQGKKLELGDWIPSTAASSDTSRVATLKEIERQHILQVLELAEWRVSGEKGAAKILGMPPTTLESKMTKLGVKRKS